MTKRWARPGLTVWLAAAVFSAVYYVPEMIQAQPNVQINDEDSQDDDGPDRQQDQPQDPPRRVSVDARGYPAAVTENGVEDTEDEDRDDDGRQIQREINDATQRMADYALGQVIASAVGSGLLIFTLGFAFHANWLARRAIATTREIGADQMRAYLHVEWMTVEGRWNQSKAGIRIENTGQTPALWVNVYAVSDVIDGAGDAPPVVLDPAAKGALWGTVPGGRFVVLPTNCEGEVEDIERVRAANGVLAIRISGRLRYETVFSEIYETEFEFHTHDLNTRTIMIEGDDVPLIDQPCKLFAAPGARLAYKRIKAGRT